MKQAFVFLTLALASQAAPAAGTLPGNLVLLQSCPGDTAKPKTRGRESLGAELLTPILTGAINQGVKTYGAHLQAAAREAEVDSVHAGGYFFEGKAGSAVDNIRCVIVATRSKRDTGTTLQAMTAGYRGATFAPDALGGAPILEDGGDGSQSLASALSALGYKDQLPAFLAVIDVENNPSTRSARLVPRYVFLDHSLREKGSKKPRDVKLSFTAIAPGAEKAILADTLVFSEISPGQARSRNLSDPDAGSLRTVGRWFQWPEAPKPVTDRVTTQQALTESLEEDRRTARLVRTTAVGFGADLPDECLSYEDSEEGLGIAGRDLALENAKDEATRSTDLIAKYTHSGTFYQTCMKIALAETKLEKTRFKDGERFLPVDLVVTQHEYRHRPVAKFFGDLFSNDTVATGVTTAMVNEFDPQTRQANSEKEATADATAMATYEQAVLDARKAQLAYAAAGDAERASALLDLEFKQRSANRLADALDMSRPFPSAGVRP